MVEQKEVKVPAEVEAKIRDLEANIRALQRRLAEWEQFTQKWLNMSTEELTALGELIQEKLREQVEEADKDEQE